MRSSSISPSLTSKIGTVTSNGSTSNPIGTSIPVPRPALKTETLPSDAPSDRVKNSRTN